MVHKGIIFNVINLHVGNGLSPAEFIPLQMVINEQKELVNSEICLRGSKYNLLINTCLLHAKIEGQFCQTGRTEKIIKQKQ